MRRRFYARNRENGKAKSFIVNVLEYAV